ncbi:MAG: ABC transporter permease [Ignavibacteriaceae bacterium]|nr:ABC transporter permease [Ignavibacteriaceae bacterium]
MFNRRTIAVIKRELKNRLMSRTFILMTLLIPLFIFGILAFQTYVMTYEGNEKTNLVLVIENENIIQKVKSEFDSLLYIKNGQISIQYKSMDRNNLSQYLDDNKKAMLEDRISGVIFVPNKALKNKNVEYYSKNPQNIKLFDKLRAPLNSVLLQIYFADRKLSQDEIDFAKEKLDFNEYRVSSDKMIEKEGEGNTIVSFMFSFLLYFSLLLTGTMMMRAVVEEKNNRIVEVLLSSVDSKELMTGKIIGTSITGLIQMAIWMLPLMIVISTSLFALPPDFAITLTMGQLLYFLFNFFIALVTFMGMFASVGAIFDNDQDAQSGLWPLMIIIMIPFFIAMGMVSNPENTLARAGSMFPFASLIIMPARMSLIDVPLWQLLVSIVVNIATLLIIFPISGKIYKVGILMTGRKPTWGEVIKWLKYKY